MKRITPDDKKRTVDSGAPTENAWGEARTVPGHEVSSETRAGAVSSGVFWHGLEPDSVLEGKYRITRTLGRGGMGVVLLAHDERLDRPVAVKLIRPEYTKMPALHDRFLTEARAMARVQHPNVVKIFTFGELAGGPYFVMEYVPGTTLEAWARERGGPPISVDEAVGVLDQVCRGVSAIHDSGATHRDLKPGNILVGPAFRVVVADLGLARTAEQLMSGEPGSLSGTPQFMAPELMTLRDVPPALAPRADVYSLGVIAYLLLTGQMPFTWDDLVAMLRQQSTMPPPAPSQTLSLVPGTFDAVLLGALCRDPEKRTPSAEAFRAALLSAQQKAHGSIKRMRLLVADDDAQYRSLVTRILSNAFPGSVVESVPDGEKALEAVDRQAPSVAVIDLDMPGLNGVELTAALRSRPVGEHFPIIVMTGRGTSSDWRLLSSLGAAGFLMKPFSPAQLVTLVRSVASTAARAPRIQ